MHYYSATDGELTFFRASKRHYRSVIIRSRKPWEWGFSSKSAIGKPDMYRAVEITKSEYEALRARRNEWLKATGRDPKYYYAACDSYLPNKLEG
jgi:hypothetical protein